MKSPFPGMDPYIEQSGLWEDFHTHLIEKIYDHLADSVPSRYIVRTAERAYQLFSDLEGALRGSIQSDTPVMLSSSSGLMEATGVDDSNDRPVSLRAFLECSETFVEIREADGENRLVTCIEVLSPVNKKANSPGWDLYQRKRQGLFVEHATSLVEIDLLRRGQRMPMVDPFPECPYVLLVARNRDIPYCKVWRGHFLRRLPVIPVPLFMPDPDIQLDLQPMIDAIYARARYHRSIDYTRPLTPPLAVEEAAWLEQQIRK